MRGGMQLVVLANIIDEIAEVISKKSQLFFVVGKPGSGKSKLLRDLAVKKDWQYVDARLLLTEEFLELLPAQRPGKAYEIMSELLAEYHAPVIVLDRIQVLFAPLLQLEPLKLLTQLSIEQKIVAAWPGEYKDGKLIFKFIGQTNCISYEFNESDVLIID